MNPNLLVNYKLYATYEKSPGTDPRMCEICKERGQCARNANGVELEWNGFKIYYDHTNKTLEFVNDFYGKRLKLFISISIKLDPWAFLIILHRGIQMCWIY